MNIDFKKIASDKELSQRVILAQEEERTRIAQEIHDDFGQALIALKIFIATATLELADKNPQLRHVFKQIKDQLNGIIDKARDLSHELFPPALKYIGLVGAIKKLIDSVRSDKKTRIKFTHRNMEKFTLKSNDIIVYRIVQEALINTLKHAQATKVNIKMRAAHGELFLEIKDNGRGFHHNKLNHRMGLGLELMRERAELVNGALSVATRPGKGTTIKIVVPIKEGQAR